MELTQELGDFSHLDNLDSAGDDLLKYLLSDTPSTDGSSPDSSPPSMFDDSDNSPMHWSQQTELSTPPTVPQLSELSLELNSEEMLFGNEYTFPMNDSLLAPSTPPKDNNTIVQPIQHQISVVPIVQPPIQILPIVQPPSSTVNVPIVEPPLLRKNRASSKKRSRTEDAPAVPSPQEQVSLPRDTLLQISSQSMEKYVENLQTSRHLTMDDQKELKRQKRLIKNRESAQLSRERKRAFIDQLEERINQLTNENNQLRADNTSLRTALSRYQPEGIIKPEISDVIIQSKNDINTKLAGLFTVGGNRASTTTKAGVCLLIVLFSFGLFMNVNKPSAMAAWKPPASMGEVRGPATFELMPKTSNIAGVTGLQRGILEYPEVKEEENDTDMYEPAAKYPKVTPFPNKPSEARADQHVVRLTTDSQTSTSTTAASTSSYAYASSAAPASASIPITTTTASNKELLFHRKIEINPAGIFKVSYSPEPATVYDSDGQHSHEEGTNSTYMLFLDPRPDLDDSDVVSSAHENQLEVATPRVVTKKDEASFPPMIISLVIPEHIANGSNPLLLPEGLDATNSMMEITCQVVDISITTSERPRN